MGKKYVCIRIINYADIKMRGESYPVSFQRVFFLFDSFALFCHRNSSLNVWRFNLLDVASSGFVVRIKIANEINVMNVERKSKVGKRLVSSRVKAAVEARHLDCSRYLPAKNNTRSWVLNRLIRKRFLLFTRNNFNWMDQDPIWIHKLIHVTHYQS